MKMGTKFNYFALSLSSLLALSACGGGGNDTPPTETHYFVGSTKTSGSELWKTDGTTNGTVMVKEINKLGGSDPANFTEVGSTIYFTANDVVHGLELWKSDAKETSLVKDINPTGDSGPHGLVANASAGKLYFIANDGVSKQGLWETDGTALGTIKIGEFDGVENITPVLADNSVFFTTVNGSNLWKYDGVSAPTTPVASGLFTDATRLAVAGTNLYFVAKSGLGFELWTSNGSDVTAMVTDLCTGTCDGMSATDSRIYSANNTVIFTDANRYLYTTDGSAAKTVMITDANAANLRIHSSYGQFSGASENFVYFHRDDNALWRTDGTSDGTVLLVGGITSDIIGFQAADNGSVFFRIGRMLWKSTGALGGTGPVYDNNSYASVVNRAGTLAYLYVNNDNGQRQIISYTTDGTDPATVLVSNVTNSPILSVGVNKLYMSYDDTVHGKEPWVSDGSPAGTAMLADVNSHPSSGSYPYGKVIFKGEVYFIADVGSEDYVLWKSNGTEEGTVQLTKGMQYLDGLTVSGDKLFFNGYDNEHGNELWVTDGTEAGTHMVIDLVTGNNGSYPYSLVDANGTLFFLDSDFGYLWKTDGTLEGTLPVSIIQPDSYLVAAGDKVYFTYYDNYDENYGNELWVSNGSYAGTKRVKDIWPGYDSGLNYIDKSNTAAIGDIFYFIANDGSNGRELWRTDGSETGTRMVINLQGTSNGLSSGNQFYTANNLLYFMARNANGEDELWKTDGTAEGTLTLTSFSESNGWINYQNGYALYNGELYFSATSATDGQELWKTNGTISGTVLVKNINPYGDSSPFGFSVVNGMLLFFANDGEHGQELWKSDGTDAGTVMVKDVAEGKDNGADRLTDSNDTGGYCSYC